MIVSLPGFNRVLTLCEVEIYDYRAPTGETCIYYSQYIIQKKFELFLSLILGIVSEDEIVFHIFRV